MATNVATSEASEIVGGDGDKILDEKKTLVTEKLLKREEERQDNVQKRREVRENESAADESAKHFTVNFARGRTEIQKDLFKCDSIDKPLLSDHFDRMSVGLLKLQKSLADATMYLPAYEIKHAQEFVNTLQVEIQTRREQLLPKKKFAFKSKKKTVDKADGVLPPVLGTDSKATDKPEEDLLDLAECKFVDIDQQTLEMTNEAINFKDVALVRLSECTVLLRGSPKAVHIRSLSKCRVLCGPVGGSIFITDCSDCVFVLPCQQLRIHTTKNTQFYIHVTSKAIIEDTSSVEFAPYSWDYVGIEEHYKLSGLNKENDNWDLIDDFNWLSADKHSPNWSLIEEKDRIQSWDV